MRGKKSRVSVFIRRSAESAATGGPQEVSSGRIFLIPLVPFSWINVGLAKIRLSVRLPGYATGQGRR